MKTEVMSFTMSKNFTIFNDLKIGLVCSVKDEKVIMRIARIEKYRDLSHWNRITTERQHGLEEILPQKLEGKLRQRGHDYVLPRIRTAF